MSRRGNIRPVQLAAGASALAAIYALVISSFDPMDLLMGFGFGLAILLGFHRFVFVDPPLPPGTLLRRTIAFFPFALAVTYEIIVGTWAVALVVLGLRPLRSPGIVEVPIGSRTPLGVAVTGLAITLSPGSILVDVDWEEAAMLVHVIDASDPDAVIAHIQRTYDRYQRKAFP